MSRCRITHMKEAGSVQTRLGGEFPTLAPAPYTEIAADTREALEAPTVQVSIVLTLIGPDRPGLVELLAQTVSAHEGNWLESRMSRLAGQFAGILHVEVPENQSEALQRALTTLASNDLRVVVESSAGDDASRVEKKSDVGGN